MANLREQFEEWAESGNGSYTDAWAAWQAATEAANTKKDIRTKYADYFATIEGAQECLRKIAELKFSEPAAKATGTAGEQWKPKALQGPRKSIFYGGNTNEHLNPLVVLISAEDYEKCCSLCEAPRVPHEMAYTVGGVANVSYVNGWNDCRDTVLGKIDDDPTNAPAEAAQQPAPVVAVKTWQERMYHPEWLSADMAMQTEIADLRAALAATNRSQP